MLNLFRKRRDPQVLVIGLDCAGPQLVFDQWRDELPNLRHLMDHGVYGELTSCTPAITVPAWSSMLTSKDPGTLGIYGFRNRADYTYDKLSIATGAAVREPRVWDILGAAGKRVIVQGVPQTYPVRPVNGCLVSCFLTPSVSNQYTYPAELRYEIDQALNGEPYEFDVKDFRTENKDWLLTQIYATSDKQFTVMRYLLDNKPWDFAMLVDIGVDRIHHGMWKFHDPTHPKHEPGNRYQNAIRDYYQHIDRQIGTLLERVPDDTLVVTVSDHGVKAMQGGLCVNEWLRREGLLVLAEEPSGEGLLPFSKAQVDWSRTRVWGEGGYYARIFMNVRGREPQGLIPADEYEATRDDLAARIEAIPGPNGAPLGTRVFKPEAIYHQVNGIAPDLIVYWGDLAWRSVGSLGHGTIYTFENDTGPDDANHAQNGLFILSGGQIKHKGQRVATRQLMDIAPTILAAYGIPAPADYQGTAIDG